MLKNLKKKEIFEYYLYFCLKAKYYYYNKQLLVLRLAYTLNIKWNLVKTAHFLIFQLTIQSI